MSGTVIHRKLVRDLIPSIVVANGGAASVRVLDQDEYKAALHAKLAEESAELRAAAPGEELGELADLLEVLRASLPTPGTPWTRYLPQLQRRRPPGAVSPAVSGSNGRKGETLRN